MIDLRISRPGKGARKGVVSQPDVRNVPEPLGSSTRTFTDGMRTAWGLLSSSPLHALVWFGLSGLMMLPAGHTTMVTVAGYYGTAHRFEPLLGITLLAFIYASVGGAIVVTVDAQWHDRPEPGRRLDAHDAGVLLVSSAVALSSLAIVTAGGAALGLIFLAVRALLYFLLFAAGLVASMIAILVAWYFLLPDLRRPIRWILTALLPAIVLGTWAFLRWLFRDALQRPVFGGDGRSTIVRGASSHFNANGRPKIPYATEAAAREAADDYFADRGARMNAYRCELGSHWHIGHAN